MLVLAVACETMYGPVQTPIEGDTAGTITVTFTVSPASASAYYSYMVQAGDEAVEVDATTLYSDGYKKAALASGTVKWTVEAPSTTVTVSKLASNTTYQIYAVAGSPMGFVGEVFNTSFTTSDTVAPAYADIASEANVVTLTFSESVTADPQAGAIKVPYYAPYSSAFKTTAAAAGEVTVPADAVVVTGNVAEITIPNLPEGCLYTISIPEGAFVDVVGQKLPAYASAMVMVEDEDGKSSPAPKGFCGELEYVELPMFGELEIESFAEWDSGFVIPMNNTYPLANYSSKNFVKVTYESVSSTTTETVVHTLEKGVDYQVTSLGFVVNLPVQPPVGANVTISIPTGCLYDIFGNDSEAWEHTMLYSYGYTLEDVVGTYDFVAPDNTSQKYVNSTFVIEESDNPEKGNVMLTTFAGIPCMANIYGTFDCDGGTLSLYGLQKFYEFVDEDEIVNSYYFYTYEEDYYVLNMPESGVLNNPNDYIGVAVALNGSLSYFGYLFLDMEAERVPAESTVAVASSEVVRFSKTLPIKAK